jgi:demethylmenaquinone methyltransferase / 2-methoxy-6-polyprenyl-1,4-benzoquinol methylase
MFGRIARRYDLANRLLSLGFDTGWRRRLVAAVLRESPADVLDLATGSGDVAFALGRRAPAVRILGMDFCAPMLDQARRRKAAAAPAHGNVRFAEGDGMALPLPDSGFDAVTISFGLRNMPDRAVSLREIRRVLRPGGRLLVLEFSQPLRAFRPLYFFYLERILPRLAGIITGDRAAYEYLNRTIRSFPGRGELAAEMRAAGFDGVTARPLTLGIVALHEGRRPAGVS